MRSLLLFLCLSLAGTRGAGASDHSMPFKVNLDLNRQVCLEWGFDEQQGDITFKLTVNTTGWVGLGFSPSGTMVGADMVLGGVGPNGIYFTDRHATGKTMPLEDTQQSYTLLSLTESEGLTIMKFSRALQTCDAQDFHITDKPIKLIFAYGTTDEVRYHSSRRGTKEVNLLNYMARTSQPISSYVSATVQNITVPAVQTYYHCRVMKLLDLPTKHHIYRISPVIEHPDLVHHMLLYSCPSFVTKTYDNPCYRGDKGDICFGVVAAWAVGGGDYEFPINGGMPIGGEPRLYRLEIHYNNIHREAGRTDNSGLRLYYTAELREHDVGILSTGVLPFNHIQYRIPPNVDQFHTYGVCNTSLFSQSMDSVPDLQVFGVLLHTHLAGRKVRAVHYRNGKQFDSLAVDENYSFEVQQIVNIGKIKTIKPNDEIAVECTYSTLNRTKVTEMGLATTDEMCLAFLFYYPAIEITSCTSHPNTTLSHDEIVEYENVLKSLPQIQLLSDVDHNFTYNMNGIIREMKKNPTHTCWTSASTRLHTSWILNPGGIMLLLLWTAIM
ncbi:DBH-like monooxygenase protein 2 homolog [Limanda limanda]|uniref:DBH-like monooxygenase protein 2 homolog n=1 Tax=Limanda limanda TaxID=27771 RepID=UPI0029C718C1|nr:DBH-like monooxygenase protein 2 homolog [Limanda limanda]